MSPASARDIALDIAGRIDELGSVRVKRFFGGASLVMDGVQFGFVMKGSLYLRVDDASRADFEALGAGPFSYEGGTKTVVVASYYETPAKILVNAENLRDWAARAHRAALAARGNNRRSTTAKGRR